MAAGAFLVVVCPAFTDTRAHIRSGESLLSFWEGEKKDISGCIQPLAPGQFLANRPEQGSRLRQQQRDHKAGHFAQAAQGARATQAKAHDQSTPSTPACGA